MEMEIDIEDFDSLRQYLIGRGHIKPDETISLKRLLGGVSNRTVRVGWSDGRGWVLKQALAKLRVDVDWFSDPERIGVEAKATRWLNVLAPKDTTPLFVFEDMPNHLMAMEAIPEESESWKSVLLSGRIVSNHFEQFGRLLGTIHRRSSEADSEISTVFGDTTYFKSLRLEPYYLYAAEKSPAAAGFLNALVEETMHHRNCLVHGDFSPKNTLIYRSKLILLDYEVVHFGDPGFDVGFALTHFLSKANHLRSEGSRIGAAAALFWSVYRGEIDSLEWVSPLEPRAVRHTLACLLARVIGKSPLEYLTPQEAARQQEVVLQLIANPPSGVNDLIAEFIRKIETYA
jgi:tRNA A-37 threonylcarbamoyl transferase component Bud32